MNDQQILLSSVRAHFDDGSSGGLQDAHVDWKRISDSAARHRVFPLFHRGLGETVLDRVPPRILAGFQERLQKNSRRNLFLTGELIRVVSLLAQQGIPAIPYKGPVLAAWLYGDVSGRQFDDLDLFLHPRDVPKALELLRDGGYRPVVPLSPRRQAATLRSRSEYRLVNDQGVLLEIQWSLTPSALSVPLDFDTLWSRRQMVSIGGGEINSFSPEDTLLILCIHGGVHLWSRLGWVCDVAQLVQLHPELDWDQVMEEADRRGARRLLLLGLALAEDLLRVELPAAVSRKVWQDPAVSPLVSRLKERLFSKEAGPFSPLELWPFYFRMRECWRDRVRDSFYMALRLVTPTAEEWNRLRLPDLLFPFYYLFRPLRLAWSFLEWVLRRGTMGSP